MKVLLLGATGRTGKLVQEYLLKNEYSVNVLVRDRNKVKNHSPNLLILEGDTTNKDDLLRSIRDCDALISVLGISRTSDFPWAKLRTPKEFLSKTMANILHISEQVDIKKIVICSAWGVHETKEHLPGWFRWFIDNSNVGVAYSDHERQETLLTKSKLNYTIVRPVGLTNSIEEKPVQISQNNSPKPKLMISRKDTARFIVDLLKSHSFPKQAVTISKK